MGLAAIDDEDLFYMCTNNHYLSTHQHPLTSLSFSLSTYSISLSHVSHYIHRSRFRSLVLF